MSFGEFLFFQRLFQKSRQDGPNYQTDYRNSTAKDTLEDSRRPEKTVDESGTPEASGGGRAAPGRPAPNCGPHLSSSASLLYRP
jgi:hypothetical protein